MLIVYVKGTTRVKGVSNKNVYYVGCVESDGYIYFNDSVSYRIPTPSTLTEATNININEVQIWYTIRNCWIRANYFTSLKVYGVDFEHMYERIGTLESKVATLESKVATLESKVATLESKVATLESKVATLETKVAQLETDVTDLQIRMTAAESGITSLQNRMNTVESDIASLQVRMTSAEINITTNRNNITAINNLLGPLQTYVGSGNNLADFLRDKFNDVYNEIDTVNNRVLYLINTEVPNIWSNIRNNIQRIAALEQEYTAIDQVVTDLDTMVRANTQLINTLSNTLSIFQQDFNNYQTNVSNTFNKLGHMALGREYNNVDGNGVTLLAVYNKVNVVIDNLNYLIDGQTIIGHVNNLPSTSMWTNWNDV